MNNIFAQLSFDTPEKTGEFAQQLGSILTAGDVVLLVGDIGAGKSYLARALIHSVQDIPEDVPSPTFTLVQTYDTRIGEIERIIQIKTQQMHTANQTRTELV